eukprot:TRINITY_DN9076_c0_g1_i3.p1 TRINITY_DN9076_c0_g1~~TRINITY_DN9076_c0_g1_i3.p1  ORF type:complete len:222 (+),score=15.40 TRINITY_DN9076_c0_g1_i3:65-730(+)
MVDYMTRANSLRRSDVFKMLTSFEGEEGLLRGSRLRTIFRCGARLLGQEKGHYELSQQVTRIDIFLSHNWSVGRIWKLLMLALSFNFSIAAASFYVVLAITGGLAMIDSPYMSTFSYGEWQVYLWSRLLCVPAFILVLLGSSDTFCRFAVTNPIAFLDKTCIDQTDDDRKRRGIFKLGAFVSKSDKMLVLYTNTYLTKLWTFMRSQLSYVCGMRATSLCVR